MENFPKVSIIILNYNGKDCLKKTLSSVLKINYPNFEVVLVDNNSIDGSLEMAKGLFPNVNIIKNSQNVGFSAGNNVGIEYSLERGADFVVLLNYDTEVKNSFLFRLIESMEENPKNGVGSPVIFKNKEEEVWFSGGKIDWFRMKTNHVTKPIREDYLNSDFISGCSMIIRAEVFKEVGLLDEDFFLYWEDADFSVRAKRAGYRLMVSAKSQIFHFEKSQEKKENKVYWLVISGLIFFKKNCPLWLKPWIFFFIIIRKIKNKIDLRLRKNSINEAVKKAYQDFRYVK